MSESDGSGSCLGLGHSSLLLVGSPQSAQINGGSKRGSHRVIRAISRLTINAGGVEAGNVPVLPLPPVISDPCPENGSQCDFSVQINGLCSLWKKRKLCHRDLIFVMRERRKTGWTSSSSQETEVAITMVGVGCGFVLRDRMIWHKGPFTLSTITRIII